MDLIRDKKLAASNAQASKQQKKNVQTAVVPSGAFKGKDQVSFSGKSSRQMNPLGLSDNTYLPDQPQKSAPLTPEQASRRKFNKLAAGAVAASPFVLKEFFQPKEVNAQQDNLAPTPAQLEAAAKAPKQKPIQVNSATSQVSTVADSSTGFPIFNNRSDFSLTLSPQDQKLFIIPFLNRPDSLSLKATVHDPFVGENGEDRSYTIEIDPASMPSSRENLAPVPQATLNLKTKENQLLPKGAQLMVNAAAVDLQNKKGKPFQNAPLAQPFGIQGGLEPFGFLRGMYKASFFPGDPEILPRNQYGGKIPTKIYDKPVSEAAALNTLSSFLVGALDMKTGKVMDPAIVSQIESQFSNDSTLRQVFRNEDNTINYQLMAALLSLKGSGFDFFIDQYTKKHADGTPLYQVFVDPKLAPTGTLARVNVTNDGHLKVGFNPAIQGDNILGLSSVLAHEAHHTDTKVSLIEETAASAIADNIYQVQLERNRSFADTLHHGVVDEQGNPVKPLLVRLQSFSSLLLHNSGKDNFPYLGIKQAPYLNGRVAPGTSYTPKSYQEGIEFGYQELNLPKTPTPGNDVLRQSLASLASLSKNPQLASPNANFDEASLQTLDRVQPLDDAAQTHLAAQIFRFKRESSEQKTVNQKQEKGFRKVAKQMWKAVQPNSFKYIEERYTLAHPTLSEH